MTWLAVGGIHQTKTGMVKLPTLYGLGTQKMWKSTLRSFALSSLDFIKGVLVVLLMIPAFAMALSLIMILIGVLTK